MKFGIILFNHSKFIVFCLIFSLSTIAWGQQAEFVWSEENETGSRIILSVYQNGVWQPGENIVEDENWNLLPTLGADSKNHKLAVWSMVEDERSILKYSIERDGQWQAAQVLTDQMTTNLAPVVVFDNKDICWVFWSANNGDDDDIYMSTLTTGKWSPPVRVNDDNDGPDILPEAGLDDAGNVWVSWQTLTGDGYVSVSKSFSASDKKTNRISNSMNIQQIEQLKSRSKSDQSMQPPAFFKSLGRASFYFPGDRKRPTRSVNGNLGS